MSNGKITAMIGAHLTDCLPHDYDVFYDHGRTAESRNVKACLGLLSQEPSNATRVADFDIVICRNRAREPAVEAIVEVEEHGFSPKTILGDIMSLMLAKFVAIKTDNGGHNVYKIGKNTVKYVFGVVKVKGSKSEQIKHFILPRLRQLIAARLLDQIPHVIVLNEYDDLGAEVIKALKASVGDF